MRYTFWGLFILTLIVFLPNGSIFATDLNFNPDTFNSLSDSYKNIYKKITMGIEELPFGSPSEEVIAKMGQTHYRTVNHHREMITYFDRLNFGIVMFELRENRLETIRFMIPDSTLRGIRYSSMKKILGKLGKHSSTNSKLIYKDANSGIKIRLIWSNNLYIERLSPLSMLIISNGDTREERIECLKNSLRYSKYFYKYIFTHGHPPIPNQN